MALKDIKAKIGATNRTNKMTRAMEAISAVKMRKTQLAALAGRPYARAALQILARLSKSTVLAEHPLTAAREPKRIALVLITSDKGLAGALNSGVIKAAAEAVAAHPADAVAVYAFGKKGGEYFARREYRTARAFENKRDDIALDTMDALAAELSQAFAGGALDRILVAYSHFKSTFEQVPTVRTLLPLSLENVRELVNDIVPERGKWSGPREGDAAPAYSIEPDGADVLGALIPRLVAVSLYHMLLESKASEHSARMVAMKNASDKSEEVAHDLTRLFNKTRQAAITREVSEIIGGREARALAI
ncbi:MAG TPA: ATP synthase F1 subunit gamma [Candidatus Paceibacterota bacterium]|nr:ATP synthase F1 subunit gamma [Candidatus Paceibacterota bacterium]